MALLDYAYSITMKMHLLQYYLQNLDKSKACHNKIPNQYKLIKFKVNIDMEIEYPILWPY